MSGRESNLRTEFQEGICLNAIRKDGGSERATAAMVIPISSSMFGT